MIYLQNFFEKKVLLKYHLFYPPREIARKKFKKGICKILSIPTGDKFKIYSRLHCIFYSFYSELGNVGLSYL